MEHFELIDWLPEIPEHFLTTPEHVLAFKKGVDIGSYKPNGEEDYAITVHDADQELVDFLQPYFEQKISVRWQVIVRDLQLHIDWGNSYGKFLYQIHAGGDDVKTNFWSKFPGEEAADWLSTEGRTLVKTIQTPLNKWCRINVKEPHEVTGITGKRFALLIRPRHD
jgi:hypothetical protein